MRRGVAAGAALDMGITNKAFDSYEQGLIRDAIAARIPGPAHRRKALRLKGAFFMEAQSYTAEERRAANQVWAAAGAYGFEPLFLARNHRRHH